MRLRRNGYGGENVSKRLLSSSERGGTIQCSSSTPSTLAQKKLCEQSDAAEKTETKINKKKIAVYIHYGLGPYRYTYNLETITKETRSLRHLGRNEDKRKKRGVCVTWEETEVRRSALDRSHCTNFVLHSKEHVTSSHSISYED